MPAHARTIHGIDLTAPGGVAKLLEHHRALFGDAQMNANGDGGEGGQPPAAPPAAPPAPPAQPPAGAPAWDGKVESLHPDVQKLIKGLRDENATSRTKARDAETTADAKIQAALAALGIKPEGEDPVEAAKKAAQERDTAASAAKRAQRELTVFKGAATHGADPARLLDSTSFLATIDGLDPADGEKIGAAIKAAVESNSYLKATRAVGASGIEQTGGPGEQQRQVTEDELKRMSAEQIVEAQNKGLLKNLLGG